MLSFLNINIFQREFRLFNFANGVTRTWDGGGGDANWSTDLNWSDNTEPGTADVASFDGTCSSNCSPTIDISISVGGISIVSGYGGTITQTNGTTVTVDSFGYSQAAGTFTGGDATSHMDINDGGFTLSGGTFTEPGGNMNIERSFTKSGSPTFTHNSGTIILDDSNDSDDTTFDCGGITINKVIITKDAEGDMIISSGCTVPLGASPTTAASSGGVFTNNGTITIDSGTWTVNGYAGANNSGANLTNNGTITHSGTGWVSKGGLVMGASGVVTYASGSTITFNKNLDVSPGGSTFPSGKTITFEDYNLADDTTLTCGSVTFTQVIITKDAEGDMIISSGCTVPLGG